jgi:hypothetical protein
VVATSNFRQELPLRLRRYGTGFHFWFGVHLMNKIALRNVAAGTAGLMALATFALVCSGAPSVAEPANLEGSWSGGGTVRFPSGDSERARCRANFRKRGGNSFSMTAVCATSSARVEQTAQLTRTGPNRFAGDFQNAEYNVSGSINITLNGNALHASLNGGGGSAHFNMGR